MNVEYDLISVTYGDYVTRVKFTASVYGGENVLPLVGDNFAALIYNYEFQGLLRRAYPVAYINQYGALRLWVGKKAIPTSQPTSLPSLQPSVQPSTRPSPRPNSVAPSVEGDTTRPSRAPTVEPSVAPSHPTPSPVDSNGCVQVGIVNFQQYQWYYPDVPSFGGDGEDVVYAVTLSVVGYGYATFGPSANDRGASSACYGTTYSPPGGWYAANGVMVPCTDTFVSNGGVHFQFYSNWGSSTFTASVCPSRSAPTMFPTAALNGKNCPPFPSTISNETVSSSTTHHPPLSITPFVCPYVHTFGL